MNGWHGTVHVFLSVSSSHFNYIYVLNCLLRQSQSKMILVVFCRFNSSEPERVEPPALIPPQATQPGAPQNAGAGSSSGIQFQPGLLASLLAEPSGIQRRRGGRTRPIDKLMLIRLLRPDRLLQAIPRFISEVLSMLCIWSSSRDTHTRECIISLAGLGSGNICSYSGCSRIKPLHQCLLANNN